MPDDLARLEDVRSWLGRAGLDLRAGEFELTAPDEILAADIAFHAQQAAEKALKAFLAWHDHPFRRTHSIEELGEQCLSLDAGLRDVIDPAVPLTEYAWRYRYPGEPDDPTAEEAASALAVARALYEAVLTLLPEDVDPGR